MGTDRKGPLAAFVVIAIVAAILLVTSVRSQARPQWFPRDQAPVTVVAAPPIGDPLRWAPVTTLGQVVEDGVVLAPKPTSDPTNAEALSATLVAATTYDASVSTTTTSVTPGTHTVTVTHHPAVHHARHHTSQHTSHDTSHATSHATRHHTASATTATVTHAAQAVASLHSPLHGRHLGSSHVSGARPAHDHGRHLGWRHRS